MNNALTIDKLIAILTDCRKQYGGDTLIVAQLTENGGPMPIEGITACAVGSGTNMNTPIDTLIDDDSKPQVLVFGVASMAPTQWLSRMLNA